MEPADLEPTRINKLHLFFVRNTNLKVFLPALVLFFVLYFIKDQLIVSQLESYTELSIMDTTYIYTADYVYRVLDSLGPQGRELYLTYELIDLPFPFTFSIMYISLLTYVYQKAFDKTHPIQKANLIPLIALFGDLIEDLLIIILLVSYPSRNMILASILPAATFIKYTAQLVFLVMLVFGLIVLLIKWIKDRK